LSQFLIKINEVKKQTGASVTACRSALESANGDVADAVERLMRDTSMIDSPFDDTDWFTGPLLTQKMIAYAEQKLGYKFPEPYLALLKTKNGGNLKRDRLPTASPTSWAVDHIKIDGMRGIGGDYGIDPDNDASIADDWGYPKVGFVFCETPTAGHNVVMFDYSLCGPNGNPRVIWVDTYDEPPAVMVLADDFASFMKKLVDDPEEE
jgi:SMI1-KNR4 cell-wall